jgi:hypothetical protein
LRRNCEKSILMNKENLESFFGFLGNFDPIWVIAILATVIVAYRFPAILKEVFTGIREHRKVHAEIVRKQHKADREIAEKRDRIQRRERAKKAPKP